MFLMVKYFNFKGLISSMHLYDICASICNEINPKNKKILQNFLVFL